MPGVYERVLRARGHSSVIRDFKIAARISAVAAVCCLFIVYTAWSFEPFVSKPAQHYPIVRCPACHLIKQPPSECDYSAQTWAWLECTRLENLYPNE